LTREIVPSVSAVDATTVRVVVTLADHDPTGGPVPIVLIARTAPMVPRDVRERPDKVVVTVAEPPVRTEALADPEEQVHLEAKTEGIVRTVASAEARTTSGIAGPSPRPNLSWRAGSFS